MKRRLGAACLLAVLVAVLCAGCGNRLSLEDYTWTMTVVFDKDGQVVACGPGAAQNHPGVEEFSLTCTAKDGAVTFQTEEDTRQGTYRQTQREAYGRLYEMEIKDWGWGYAVCSWTKSDTGERRPTLVLTFPKEYTLYFTGE